MKGRSIVFLNRFYWPDVAATGQMLTDLAEDMAAGGWRVTVVTSTGRYEGGGALPARDVNKLVSIVRVGVAFGNRGRLWSRVGGYLSYSCGALAYLLLGPRFDALVALSDPPFALAITQVAAAVRGGRTVYWVQDVFPEIAARLGVISEKNPAFLVMAAVARALTRRCNVVVVIGARMKETLLRSGASVQRTVVVQNWADAAAIFPMPAADNTFLDEHQLRGRFVVLYSGNAGRAHTFEAVVEAMRRLRDDPAIVFVFIGGGAMIPHIRTAVASEGLPNVLFLPYVCRSRLSWSLSAADVSLVTEDPSVVGLLVPSKAYGILASGRPILFVGSPESDVATLVHSEECGVVVDPSDPAALVSAIQELKSDEARRLVLGSNARRAAEWAFDRRHATRAWASAVEEVLWPGRSVGAIDG